MRALSAAAAARISVATDMASGTAAAVTVALVVSSGIVWFSMLPAASAAICAFVLSSAPSATKLTSPSTDRRTIDTGPSKVCPLALADLPCGTNSVETAWAPTDACHGKPFSPASTISRATAPPPLTTPATRSTPSTTETLSVCPTISDGLWSLRIGRGFALQARPARSITVGCRQPRRPIAPPV